MKVNKKTLTDTSRAMANGEGSAGPLVIEASRFRFH